MLRPPADPTRFRIQVGRYKERHYHDPLPGCQIAPATDEVWPSITSVKKAWPRFMDKWIADMVAQRAINDWNTLAQLDRQARYAVLASAATNKRDAAAERGSKIHQLIERIAFGQPIDEVWDDEVMPFVRVARQLVADLQPEWLFTEAVMISRRLRVGGTADAGWRISDRNYIVDYKTRLEHRCYDDEGAQLGGYSAADYMIVDDNGTAVRRRLPEFEQGLIITISPDSYEFHPVDLPKAQHAFEVLRAFYDVQQDRDLVGKPIVLAPNGTPDDGGLRAEHARQRLNTLAGRDANVDWPAGIPTFKEQRLSKHVYRHDELVLIEAALTEAEKTDETPFGPNEPVPSPERVATMVARLRALPADLLEQVFTDAEPHQIPKVTSAGFKIRHLDLLEPIVDAAEQAAGLRAQAARDLLDGYGEDPQLGRAILTLAGCTDLAAVGDAERVKVEAVVAALNDTLVVVNYSETGDVLFVCSDKTEQLVVQVGGGTRPLAVRHCKEIADKYGLPRHRSVGAAAADPLLAALIVHDARVAA